MSIQMPGKIRFCETIYIVFQTYEHFIRWDCKGITADVCFFLKRIDQNQKDRENISNRYHTQDRSPQTAEFYFLFITAVPPYFL